MAPGSEGAWRACHVLWKLDVDQWRPAPAEWALWESFLSPAERRRVHKYHFAIDRRRALASALLQYAFAYAALGIRGEDAAFDRTDAGKPFLRLTDGVRAALAERGLHNVNYNVSHHGAYVVLAGACDCIVGVDVTNALEDPRQPVEQFFASFGAYFTEEEWHAMEAAAAAAATGGALDEASQRAARLRAFHRHWAAKEAVLKAQGQGIGAVPLRSISIALPSNAETHFDAAVGGAALAPDWRFRILDIGRGHVAAVAAAPPRAAHPSAWQFLDAPRLCSRGAAAAAQRLLGARAAFRELRASDLLAPHGEAARAALLRARSPQQCVLCEEWAPHVFCGGGERPVEVERVVLWTGDAPADGGAPGGAGDPRAVLLIHDLQAFLRRGDAAEGADAERLLRTLRGSFAAVVAAVRVSRADPPWPLLALCDRAGVGYAPQKFRRGGGAGEVAVVPLFHGGGGGGEGGGGGGECGVADALAGQMLRERGIVPLPREEGAASPRAPEPPPRPFLVVFGGSPGGWREALGADADLDGRGCVEISI